MGIVNVTPDSFSDGGRFLNPSRAVEQALRLVDEGAEIVDLGAESTRPGGGVYGAGMREVEAEEELARLLPVLQALRPRTEAVLSVDTRKGAVARAVLAAGADWINDVGGLREPELIEAVAEAGCPIVVMHSRGELARMQRDIAFDDVVREVTDELMERVQRAEAAGIERSRIVLDPGIGFGKTAAQNLALLRRLDSLVATGLPVLVGASRKSFLAAAANDDSPPTARLGGSLAAAAWAARLGASILRVHDVAVTAQFLRVLHAIDSAR
jgi:dihydropteroate synthase